MKYSDPKQTKHFELNAEEKFTFERQGWLGPFPLLTPLEASEIAEECMNFRSEFASPEELEVEIRSGRPQAKPWYKSLHGNKERIYDICADNRIVRKIASLIGDDVLLWGSSCNFITPGSGHRWHVDVEHLQWDGVSVFLGLQCMDQKSTLKIITGSHRIDPPPQSLGINSDELALRYCQEIYEDATLVNVPVSNGEFFLFSGRVWHASSNVTSETRASLIIQYCNSYQKTSVPLNFNPPIRWHPSQPPCALVSGNDLGRLNNIVRRPGRVAYPEFDPGL